MIQQFLNGMLTLMLAKFALNDVPHAMGLGSPASPPWLDNAWCALLQYMDTTEYKKTLVTAPSFRESFDEAEKLIGGWFAGDAYYNSYVPMTLKDLGDLRIVLAGYFTIAEGQASNKMVDDVFYILKRRLDVANKDFADEEWAGVDFITFAGMTAQEQAGLPVEEWWNDVAKAYKMMVEAVNRAGKAISIDAVMHAVHTHGPALSYLFIGVYETKVEWAIRDMLGRLVT